MGLVPVSRPETFNTLQLATAFSSIMDNAWFTNDGPLVQRFEKQIANRLIVPSFVAMANGTLALEAAEFALFAEGSLIAIPSFTFAAVAGSLVKNGHHLRFVDVNPNTWTMDWEDMSWAEGIDGAVIPTVFGVPPESGLTGFLLKRAIPVIVDNAEGFGAYAGVLGTVDTYSFHATKVLTCGEGGGVAGMDLEWFRQWRNFGFTGASPAPSMAGTNAKMSEFHAAIGLLSLERFGRQMAERRRLLDLYRTELSGKVEFQTGRPYNCVILTGARDKLMEELAKNGVDSRPYFYPLHKVSAFDEFAETPFPLIVTEYVSARSLALPLWAGLRDGIVGDICKTVREVIG